MMNTFMQSKKSNQYQMEWSIYCILFSRYIKKCLGVPTTGNIEALKAKLEELEQRKAELLAKQPH